MISELVSITHDCLSCFGGFGTRTSDDEKSRVDIPGPENSQDRIDALSSRAIVEGERYSP